MLVTYRKMTLPVRIVWEVSVLETIPQIRYSGYRDLIFEFP